MLGLEGSEAASEEGSVLSRRSKLSVLGVGSAMERKRREEVVEKKGNVSKVGVEVEVLPGAKGLVTVSGAHEPVNPIADVECQFDLEVRYTYRVEDVAPTPEKASVEKGSKGERSGAGEYKTFTFWVRLKVGEVEEDSSG